MVPNAQNPGFEEKAGVNAPFQPGFFLETGFFCSALNATCTCPRHKNPVLPKKPGWMDALGC
jgi:hypothetical protein